MKYIYLLALIFLASCSSHHDKIPEQEKDFCSGIPEADHTSLSEKLVHLENLMKTKTGVYVLEDGGGAMTARAWLAEHAEKTIDVQYFIFSTDNIGLIASDFLVRAADRGIKVRVLIDDVNVDAGEHEILALDAHENISVKIYNPGTNIGKNIFQKVHKLATDFKGANQRMHNKTFTVDGKVVITGGRNIADEYFDYDHDYNFRDRDVLLAGTVLPSVKKSFNDFWSSPLSVAISDLIKEDPADVTVKDKYERLHQYACNPANFNPKVREKIKKLPDAFQDGTQGMIWLDNVSFVSDVPGKNNQTAGLSGGGICTDTLLKLIMEAKKTIDIESPYLVTSDSGKELFRKAVKRGVKIRVLTNSLAASDNMEAFSGYQRDRKQILETGIRIFEFRPDAEERNKIMTGELLKNKDFKPVFGLHAKSMVVDGVITVIGTFNLDPRSANLNTECIAVIRSAKVSKAVLRGIEEEFKPENSWETTLKHNPDSMASTFKRVNAWSRKVIPKAIL